MLSYDNVTRGEENHIFVNGYRYFSNILTLGLIKQSVLYLLFKHSTKGSITHEERLATSFYW